MQRTKACWKSWAQAALLSTEHRQAIVHADDIADFFRIEETTTPQPEREVMQTPRELPELPVVCHGMRRKGESAVIGVIPEQDRCQAADRRVVSPLLRRSAAGAGVRLRRPRHPPSPESGGSGGGRCVDESMQAEVGVCTRGTVLLRYQAPGCGSHRA